MAHRALPTLLFAATTLLVSALPSDAQEPNFGRAVAMTERDLFIGQPVNWYGPGVVYAYRATGVDWSAPTLLTAPDSARKDDFGRALAADGNRLVVSAPRKRDGSGVVYAFTRTSADGAWRFDARVEPPAGIDASEYGAAVALSGAELLVGAPAAEGTGVVYHFTRGGAGWTLTETLRPTDGDAAAFGASLAWEGAALLVGSPAADSARGRVYAIDRVGRDGWAAPRRVALPDEATVPGAAAGHAVAVADDRAFVGAPGAGAVVALERGGDGSWRSTATVRPPTSPAGTAFGFSVLTLDDQLWVGAPSVNRTGRVFRFAPNANGGWRSIAALDPDDTSGASWPLGFGYALAAADGRAVVSMPTRDFGEGRAMTFSRSGSDSPAAWRAGDLLEGEIFRIGQAIEQGDLCVEGRMTEFPCTNMEMVAHMQVDDLGGERGVWVNDVWGWTDPETGRDYALVARRDGASFVEVTDPAAPRLVGNLPRTVGSPPSVWRDIKVIGTHAFVVSDGAGAHGMQVFDLTRLRDVGAEPVDFEPNTTYHEIHSAHNVVADTASGFLYIVGANSGGETCGGGLHIVDARDPLEPSFAGCYNDPSSPGANGYTHDAQCLVYQGPDEEYRGREICLGSNATELNIADVTDKGNPVTIARMSYPNVAYAHQGWLDEEQRYFYMNDELDEIAGNVEGTRTIVWDLTELDDPVVVNQYIGPVRSSDHNLYVVGDRMYQSNYGSGLRVLDISDRANPFEIAHFDSAPYNDNGPGTSSQQSGAWSNYPFFDSGVVIFTSVREGLFIMRVRPPPVS